MSHLSLMSVYKEKALKMILHPRKIRDRIRQTTDSEGEMTDVMVTQIQTDHK